MTTSSSSASGSEISVLCAGAMHHILDDLAPAFERMRGKRIVPAFASSGGVKNRVLNGEDVDVVITTQAAMDELAGKSRIANGSAAVMARSPIGVAVRAGAPKPDIGTIDTFKRALMQAESLAYADPATGSPSANHLVKVLDRLGLSDALRAKTRLIGATPGSVVVVCDAVAKGEAEIGIQQISEILGVAGVDLVGPLPDDVQHLTVFSAAVGAHARNTEAASKLVVFLTSADAAPIVEKHGMVAPAQAAP